MAHEDHGALRRIVNTDLKTDKVDAYEPAIMYKNVIRETLHQTHAHSFDEKYTATNLYWTMETPRITEGKWFPKVIGSALPLDNQEHGHNRGYNGCGRTGHNRDGIIIPSINSLNRRNRDIIVFIIPPGV